MERLTVTTLDRLQEGDRFYLQKDKKKTVREVVCINRDVWDKVISASIVPVESRQDAFAKKNIGKPAEFAVVFLRSPDDDLVKLLKGGEQIA